MFFENIAKGKLDLGSVAHIQERRSHSALGVELCHELFVRVELGLELRVVLAADDCDVPAELRLHLDGQSVSVGDTAEVVDRGLSFDHALAAAAVEKDNRDVCAVT